MFQVFFRDLGGRAYLRWQEVWLQLRQLGQQGKPVEALMPRKTQSTWHGRAPCQNEKVIRSSHRAYIALEDTLAAPQVSANDHISFIFSFENVGTTLAQDVKFSVYLGLVNHVPTPTEIDQSLTTFDTLGTIAPSLSVPIIVDRGEQGYITLTDTALADLRAERCFLLIATKLIYSDIFGLEHETRASLKVDRETLRFHLTPFYNEVD